MQKEQLKPEEVELEEIAPLTLQNFEEFYASSGGHQSCLDIAAHDNFIKIQPDVIFFLFFILPSSQLGVSATCGIPQKQWTMP